MALYHLRQIPLWADYGSILTTGLSAKRDEESGSLLLERVGPFAPPIMFGLERLVGKVVLVTESFKEKVLSGNFGDVSFKPTVKKHIAPLPWERWDRHAEMPPKLPTSGEPEEYIEGQEHSKQTALEMEEIWEFIAPVSRCNIEKRERLPHRPLGYRCFSHSHKRSTMACSVLPAVVICYLLTTPGAAGSSNKRAGGWILRTSPSYDTANQITSVAPR